MDASTDDRLKSIAITLGENARIARECGYEHAERLMLMAQLDIRMKLNGISDAEMNTLFDAVAARPNPTQFSWGMPAGKNGHAPNGSASRNGGHHRDARQKTAALVTKAS